MKFQKNKDFILDLINSGSQINAMISAYIAVLGLKVFFIAVKTQKIDTSFFQTFNMVIASFQVLNKLGKAYFQQKTFLLTDIRIEVFFEKLFLILKIQFANKELT